MYVSSLPNRTSASFRVISLPPVTAMLGLPLIRLAEGRWNRLYLQAFHFAANANTIEFKLIEPKHDRRGG